MNVPRPPNRTEASPNTATIVIARARVDYRFTRREADVARLLQIGSSNKEIAVRLRIQVGTARSHVASILKKTVTNNRTRAALRLCGMPIS